MIIKIGYISFQLGRMLETLTGRVEHGGCRAEARPASPHRFKVAIRSFFAWAGETGLISENPAGSVTLRRLPRTPRSILIWWTEPLKRPSNDSDPVKTTMVIPGSFRNTGFSPVTVRVLPVDKLQSW